jgi:hypothetical protein
MEAKLMRNCTSAGPVGLALLLFAAAPVAAQGLPDIGQAATGVAKDAVVGAAKKAATDRVGKAVDDAKAAAVKACLDKGKGDGLTGKALRAFVASCRKTETTAAPQ